MKKIVVIRRKGYKRKLQMLHKKSYMTNYLLQKYQATNIAEFFIEYSDATSHMVTNEENMTNL